MELKKKKKKKKEYTTSDTLGIHWVAPNESSCLEFLLTTLQVLLTILLIFCLFHKIAVSCLTKCVTESLMN